MFKEIIQNIKDRFSQSRLHVSVGKRKRELKHHSKNQLARMIIEKEIIITKLMKYYKVRNLKKFIKK